ncbi:MAG: hypothetical protein ACSHWW_02920 [Nonlabens sp.]|uniref:hypothetical protein n=1 Tax=Nonlabens sp. TaxID=1888209 RepID=UPI003EF733A7
MKTIKYSTIYILAFLSAMFLVIVFSFSGHNTVTFYGFAENQETEINMEHDVTIQKINVTVGEKVQKGTVLMEVVSSSLPMDISKANYEIEELKTKYLQWKTDLDWKINTQTIALEEKTAKINTEIQEQLTTIKNNNKLYSIISNDQKVTSQDAIESPVLIKIESLKEQKEITTNLLSTEIKRLKSERYAVNNPMLSRIKSLEEQLKHYDTRLVEQTIVAPTDGLIGNIHCKEDEKLEAFNNMLSFYEESPTQIVGFIHEELLLKVNINDEVIVTSGSRPNIQNTGIVKTLGSRIVEIPPRLRKIKDLKTYGREVIIEIPADNPFLQKEKVVLNLKN